MRLFDRVKRANDSSDEFQLNMYLCPNRCYILAYVGKPKETPMCRECGRLMIFDKTFRDSSSTWDDLIDIDKKLPDFYENWLDRKENIMNRKIQDFIVNWPDVRDKLGDLDSREKTLNYVNKLSVQIAMIHVQRALKYYERGNVDKALAILTKAIQIDPNCGEAYYNRSEFRLQAGDFDGAIADTNRAIEINPNDADAYTNRASARGQKGDLAGAIEDADKAVRINPKHAMAYFTIGVAHINTKDFESATANFRNFLELAPDDPRANQIRSLLKNILG